MNEVNTNPTAHPDPVTPNVVASATDLLDSDLSEIRAHLADAFATRGVFAMWTCCQDEASLLGDVDRLAAEVGRLRHDFAVISDDLDDMTADRDRLARANRELAARNTALRLDRDAQARKATRLARQLGADPGDLAAALAAELDRVRDRAALADADHARLIAHVRAALATGDLAVLRAEMNHRGLDPNPGQFGSPAAALAAPVLARRSASSTPTAGTVYLLHFQRPYRHARHYLGWASDLPARLAEHAAGRGARLLAVIQAAGIGWTLASPHPGTATQTPGRRRPAVPAVRRHPAPIAWPMRAGWS